MWSALQAAGWWMLMLMLLLLLLLLLLLACPVGSGVLVTVLAVGARLQPLQRHERGGLLSCDAVVVVTCDV